MMNKFIMKLRLIQIVKKAYQLKWFKISKFRRDFYFELYRSNKLDDLHMCLYDLTGESPYNDRGRAWYFHYDGKWNKEGIHDEQNQENVREIGRSGSEVRQPSGDTSES